MSTTYYELRKVSCNQKQCDQIGQFITLWATFQSPWQQLFCPNCHHILGNFCKFVKIFHFTSQILLGNFYRHLATFYWSHWSKVIHIGTLSKINEGIVLITFSAPPIFVSYLNLQSIFVRKSQCVKTVLYIVCSKVGRVVVYRTFKSILSIVLTFNMEKRPEIGHLKYAFYIRFCSETAKKISFFLKQKEGGCCWCWCSCCHAWTTEIINFFCAKLFIFCAAGRSSSSLCCSLPKS